MGRGRAAGHHAQLLDQPGHPGIRPRLDLITDIDRTGWGFQLFLGAIRRSQPDERGNYDWTLESDGITISLGAPGFTQYLRRPPVHCPRHALPVEERGGFSFDRCSYTLS